MRPGGRARAAPSSAKPAASPMRQTVPVRVHGGRAADAAQRMEAVQRRQAQGVDAADHGRIEDARRIMRAALPNTFAVVEQAEDTTNAGPSSPR